MAFLLFDWLGGWVGTGYLDCLLNPTWCISLSCDTTLFYEPTQYNDGSSDEKFMT